MRVIDVLTSPWAILPNKFNQICDIYSTHLKGEKINVSDIEARIGQSLNSKEQGYDLVAGVAIIPIDGVISKKMNLFSRISGGASTQFIKRDIEDALNDPEVKAIILHIDSPGGAVDGTSELSDFIKSVRGHKPIHVLADGCMASAAYWIGCAADKIFISSSTTQVGSIGVVCTHVDESALEANEGIKTTEITAGKYKRITSNYEPLSEEGRADIQATVDYIYTLFVDSVADCRGVTSEKVLENMADGRLFIGQQAIDAGLVDGDSTLDELIKSLSSDTPIIHTAKAGVAQSAEDLSKTKPDEENSMSEITVKSLENDHPKLAKHFIAMGITQGAQGERDRIQAVRDISMPGHEELVETLMFDGKTTGPEAAVQVLQAEKTNKAKASAKIAADAEDVSNVPAASAPVNQTSTEDNELSAGAKIKKDWDASAELRAEFGEDFDSYSAFATAKNADQVNILGGK